jgi:hypothetical protein
MTASRALLQLFPERTSVAENRKGNLLLTQDKKSVKSLLIDSSAWRITIRRRGDINGGRRRMRKLVLGLAAATALSFASEASATVLVAGSTSVAPAPFNLATQGTLLASQSQTGTVDTFSATFNQAVYRNTSGFLDFYFQVMRTGAGAIGNDDIKRFTNANFTGFTTDVFTLLTDPDGAGIFVASTNGASTTTFSRDLGGVLEAAFGTNTLTGTEIGETVIYRTNATSYQVGTFGVIDGSVFGGRTFAPGVPEPATWAMMLLGFGGIGMAMRRRRNPALAQVA